MNGLRHIVLLLGMGIFFAQDPLNWTDNPGDYEFTATISGAVIVIDGEQLGDEDDMFAAFDDDSNVRDLAIQLFPSFGPYQDTPVYEMQMDL